MVVFLPGGGPAIQQQAAFWIFLLIASDEGLSMAPDELDSSLSPELSAREVPRQNENKISILNIDTFFIY